MKTNRSRSVQFRILFIIIIFHVFSVILLGCNSNTFSTGPYRVAHDEEYISKSDFLLNTVVSIKLYDKQDMSLIDGAFELIKKYEGIYSKTLETSELYRLNHGLYSNPSGRKLSYSISKELADVIDKALSYSKMTAGGFDLTIGPISSLWNFQTSLPSLPEAKELKRALTLVDYNNVKLTGTDITFAKEGIEIDLGAIAKGYIADRVKEYLLDNGIKSALINLGGNLLCIGNKPGDKPFHIGIQKPYADRNETIATMEITDLSVVSSGVYERFFELDGVMYHHILDPKTGYPSKNGLISVTIISKNSVDGDGLSTSCFALGLKRGLKLIESLPNTYAVFITEDYELYYSTGFEAAIRILP